MTLQDTDKKLKNIFGLKNFDTLSNIKNIERVNFDQDIESEIDLKKLYKKAFELISKLFDKKSIYMRLTFWDKTEFIADKYSANILEVNNKKDKVILLLKFKSIDDEFFDIIKQHLNFELAKDPSVNITCFMFNFETSTLLNIYDDRGADFIVLK